MLLRFVCKNYLSLGGEVDFNLFPYSKIRQHRDHIYDLGEVDVLKSVAVYGANGSGKSNFIGALNLLHDLATNQTLRYERLRDISFKLDSARKEIPTTLEVEFYKENEFYSYGVDLHDGMIQNEWLYQLFPKKNKDKLLFNRKMDGISKAKIEVADHLMVSDKDRLRIELYEEEIKHDQTLLSFLSDKSRFLAFKDAYEWFLHDLHVIRPGSRAAGLIEKLVDDEQFIAFANDVIRELDTGITEIQVEKVPLNRFFGENDRNSIEEIKNKINQGVDKVQVAFGGSFAIAMSVEGEILVHRIVTKHTGKDNTETFGMDEESDGTVRLLDLLPAIEMVLTSCKVVFVDEIGRNLHPSLLKEFIRLFLKNPSHGQLVFTTHEDHLLDLSDFRQDEIWFVQKNDLGHSSLYPLSEFQPRYDLNIQKGYLKGRFGAIPFLAGLDNLKIDRYAAS